MWLEMWRWASSPLELLFQHIHLFISYELGLLCVRSFCLVFPTRQKTWQESQVGCEGFNWGVMGGGHNVGGNQFWILCKHTGFHSFGWNNSNLISVNVILRTLKSPFLRGPIVFLLPQAVEEIKVGVMNI